MACAGEVQGAGLAKTGYLVANFTDLKFELSAGRPVKAERRAGVHAGRPVQYEHTHRAGTDKENTVEYQTRRQALPWMNLLGGVAIGALAMYIADPSQGRRRRALLQDKVSSASHQTSTLVNRTMRDARHRLAGLQAEAMRAIAPREVKPLDNHVLEARVRSRLGRAMPGLQGIAIAADDGVVTLSGSIDDEAAQVLIDAVAAIPGVESVSDALLREEEGSSASTPAMADARHLTMRGTLWTAAALGAGALAWYTLSRRQPLGLVAAATGLGLMARGRGGLRGGLREALQGTVAEAWMHRFDALRSGRFAGIRAASGIRSGGDASVDASGDVGEFGEGIDAQRSIAIAAAPETVFDVWSHYENFPHFMSHVIEVRDLGDGRSHWVVQGPAGSEVEFVSALTAVERPSRLAWHSEPGSDIDTEGLVVLEPAAGGTRATVRMRWYAPAGGSGKALAMLTGVDPDQALEDDLRRMKQFIERGLPTGEGGIAGSTAGSGAAGTGTGAGAGAGGGSGAAGAAGAAGATGGNVLH